MVDDEKVFKLSDLPPELLFLVFEQVDNEAQLFGLSSLCSAFHFPARSIYFSRYAASASLVSEGVLSIQNVESPMKYWSNSGYGLFPLLRAVASCLFIRSLTRLYWRFESPDLHLRAQFLYLHRLLDALDTVQSVTLDFHEVRLTAKPIHGEETVIVWANAALDLLDKLLLEKKCTSLTIYRGDHFSHPALSSEAWARKSERHSLGARLKTFLSNSQLTRTPSWKVAGSLPARMSTILSGCSDLTSINLTSYATASDPQWTAISSTVLPHLTSFSISLFGGTRFFQDIASFLTRQPSLVTIRLSGFRPFVQPVQAGDRWHFASLQVLATTPDLALSLLTGKAYSLPSLTEICFVVECTAAETTHRTAPTTETLNALLRVLHDRLDLKFSITSYTNYSWGESMVSIYTPLFHGLMSHPNFYEITFTMDIFPHHYSESWKAFASKVVSHWLPPRETHTTPQITFQSRRIEASSIASTTRDIVEILRGNHHTKTWKVSVRKCTPYLTSDFGFVFT